MSNLKASIMGLLLIGAFVVPFLIQMVIDSFQQQAFLKTTVEVAELVKEEGGVSEHVKQVTGNLSGRGYEITFDRDGLVEFGETVTIRYKYEYMNIRGKEELDTSNTVTIHKRLGLNRQGEKLAYDTFSVVTPESLEPNKEYTFTVPGLKNLASVSSNTGSVEVVAVNGDKVTVKVRDGAKKTVVTGEYIPADNKWVTGQTSANYNSGGYTGVLSQYLHSGEHTPGDSKYVTGQTSSNYNSGGYTGVLSQYLHSGGLTPSDSKYVTAQTSSNYNSGGYSGSLNSYVYSGSYTPGDSKYVTGQTSSNYNSGGYTGSLSQYLHSGSYTPSASKTETDTRSSTARFRTDSNGYVTTVIPVSTPNTVYYNSNGYTGSLSKISESGSILHFLTGMYSVGDYHGMENLNMSDTVSANYSGTVTRPATDTRVYRYQGTVTKPAIDTRVYRYQGTVTKPGTDTRVYRYQGTVTKPGTDTRVYRYQGTVTKPGTDTRKTEHRYQYELDFDYLRAS